MLLPLPRTCRGLGNKSCAGDLRRDNLWGLTCVEQPVYFCKRVPAEVAPLQAAEGAMFVYEVVGAHYVLVQAVGPVPGVAHKAKDEVVLPQLLHLVN